MILGLEGYLAPKNTHLKDTQDTLLRNIYTLVSVEYSCTLHAHQVRGLSTNTQDAFMVVQNSAPTFHVPRLGSGSGFGLVFLFFFLDLNSYIRNALLFWSDTPILCRW